MVIVLPIEPKATPRPRVAGKRAYYPKSYVDWKRRAKSLLPALNVPKSVHVTFIFPRPKRMKKGERIEHDKRPDLDNLIKSVFDLFDFDDGKISNFGAAKYYAASHEDPKIIIVWREDVV